MLDNTLLIALLSTLGTVFAAIVGAYFNHIYNKRKVKLSENKLALDSSTQLFQAFIEDRKLLMEQSKTDREFFTGRLRDLETSYNGRIKDLETKVRELETANSTKDTTIMAQQKKIDEQELQIHSQQQLIEVLQGEVKELKKNEGQSSTRG